jgi:transposase InsO family protein
LACPARRYVVTDHGPQFTAAAFAEALCRRGIRPRRGAIGRTGSVAIIERLWRSMKSEYARGLFLYSSRPGENVIDLFGGSGSTLIAAEQTGRKAFLMEIDPLYCDVIVKRWEGFTGRKAERTLSVDAAPR